MEVIRLDKGNKSQHVVETSETSLKKWLKTVFDQRFKIQIKEGTLLLSETAEGTRGA